MTPRVRRPRPEDYLDEGQYQTWVKERLDRAYDEVVVQWHPFAGEGEGDLRASGGYRRRAICDSPAI